MKKIILIGCFLFIAFCISCKKQYTGVFSPIEFSPEKVTLPPSIDTVEVKANKWIDITGAHTYPFNYSNKVLYPNITQDTLKAGWMKAIALNNEGEHYVMKIIILEENNTGKERGYTISVGNGPSFGSLLIIQAPK